MALANLTTWEHVSWYKITYLKSWPRRMGSPFYMGVLQNLKFYFFGGNITWKIPDCLPKRPKRPCLCF